MAKFDGLKGECDGYEIVDNSILPRPVKIPYYATDFAHYISVRHYCCSMTLTNMTS